MKSTPLKIGTAKNLPHHEIMPLEITEKSRILHFRTGKFVSMARRTSVGLAAGAENREERRADKMIFEDIIWH
ncbi:MAG: hypothetical protein WAK26_14395 [Terracidiphilus sp.]